MVPQAILLKYLAIGLGVLMILAAFAGSYWAVYELGKANQAIECNEDKLEALEEQREALELDAAERVKTATEAGKRQAKLEQNLGKAKENLDEAIDNAGSNPACNLSDDELRAFEELVNS